MGYFSWVTSDTKKSISNCDSLRPTFPVYLLCPDGTKILETNYQGYGVFGGQDVYALLAKWNVPEKCTGEVAKDRLVGINEEFASDDLKYPLKFVEDGNLEYASVEASEYCNSQGFMYEGEDEDE